MIHYHGTPVGGSRQDVARFLQGRHALIPFFRQEDLGIAAEVCKSFVFDNSAFSVWKTGGVLDVPGYIKWVRDWCRHPGFSWALIPDSIDGGEAENDALLEQWPEDLSRYGVPVWHLHESLDRLQRLSLTYPTVALGSSGQWSNPGTGPWWRRMEQVMDAVCDDECRPVCKLHGLRMLDPAIFSRLPLTSADSTNAAMNAGSINRFGMYTPPTSSQRSAVIAERIEAHNSAPVWVGSGQQSMAL